MDQETIIQVVYVVIGLVAAVITGMRLLAGAWTGALLTGAIAAFCAYRLYTLQEE